MLKICYFLCKKNGNKSLLKFGMETVKSLPCRQTLQKELAGTLKFVNI